MGKIALLSHWKIIFGIIIYIILGELSKEVIIFPFVEPYLLDRFNAQTAEQMAEISEYVLLAAILVPVAILFIINPVNRSNGALVALSSEMAEKNKDLQLEITERITIQKEKEELIQDLQRALLEIKTLRGIIPICSYCKEIRNDKGSWVHLEKYIQDHSHAEFSHSICDACLDKHFPEEFEEEDSARQ